MEGTLPTGLLALSSITDYIEDEALKIVYRQFHDQLEIAGEGTVVLSNPLFFSVETDKLSESVDAWLGDLTPDDHNKLLILSMLTRPFSHSAIWPKDKLKFIDNPMVRLLFPSEREVSLYDEGATIPYGLDTLTGRRKLQADPGFQKLLETIPIHKPLADFSSEHVGWQPGSVDYQSWQVAQWSDNWAAVYVVTNAGHIEGYPFPWLLGFCQRKDLEQHFMTLLREAGARFDPGFYSAPGIVNGPWVLAKLALSEYEDGLGPSWTLIDELVPLKDNDLNCLLSTYHTDGNDEWFNRISGILGVADEIGLGDLSLSDLIDKAGSAVTLDELEACVEVWREAYEQVLDQEHMAWERRLKEHEAILAPHASTIDALVDEIGGDKPRHPMGVGQWRRRRATTRRFLEEYVMDHHKLPQEVHEIGEYPSVISANFTELQKKVEN